MSRNALYGLIVILVVVVIGTGIYAYQQSQRPALQVTVDGSGVRINGSGGHS